MRTARHEQRRCGAGVWALAVALSVCPWLPSHARLSKLPSLQLEMSDHGTSLHATGYRKRVRIERDFEVSELGEALRFYEVVAKTPVTIRFSDQVQADTVEALRNEVAAYGVEAITLASPDAGRGANTEAEPAAVPTPAAVEAEPDAALWAGLRAAWPEAQGEIEVYAARPDYREICFRSAGQTLLYSAGDGQVRTVEPFSPGAERVNRITYEEGVFVLWAGFQRLGVVPGGAE